MAALLSLALCYFPTPAQPLFVDFVFPLTFKQSLGLALWADQRPSLCVTVFPCYFQGPSWCAQPQWVHLTALWVQQLPVWLRQRAGLEVSPACSPGAWVLLLACWVPQSPHHRDEGASALLKQQQEGKGQWGKPVRGVHSHILANTHMNQLSN